jgi:hypothetical protein
MIAYDFELDDDGDLKIENNDLVIGPSDLQHIEDILSGAPGHFKEFPLVGWNPYKRLNARTSQVEINQSAKQQLQSDGYEVRALNLALSSDGTITLTELDIYRP